MKKVYTSAVVIIPPIELWSSIQAIRAKYDCQINRWMPHITLLYPFIPEEELDMIKEAFVPVCHNCATFEVVLKEFDYFHHGKEYYTIWIRPFPSKLIIELQQSLLELVPDCNDVNLHNTGFVPHLSLCQINGKNQMLSLLEEIRKNWTEIRFLLHQIYFITRKPTKNSKFETTKTISLNK
jgi:2'-5' RNA ligase